MKKPASVRALMEQACPDLATNPERLTIFIERGNIVATGSPSLSFEYRYTLNIVVTDFPDSPDVLVVPLIAWLKVNQPDLFTNPSTAGRGFRFESEILNHQTADIEIQLDLSELVRVQGHTVDGVNRLVTEHIGESILTGPADVTTALDLAAEWKITPLVPTET